MGGPVLVADEHTGATVSSDLARIFFKAVGLSGDALRTLLLSAGIDPALIQRPYQRLSAAQFDVLWTAMEQAAGDPCFGLYLGALRQHMPFGHVLVASMLNSATLGQALERFCRYHDILADVLRPELLLEGDEAVLRVASFSARFVPHRHHVECVAAVLAAMLQQLSEGRLSPRFRFRHAPPVDLSEHQRILGSALQFDQADDSIILRRSDLLLVIPTADEELAQVLDRHAEEVLRRLRPGKQLSGTVAALLGDVLCDGRPALGQVAKRLAMSPRSLQSKLRAEGSSFRELLDAARESLARRYLSRSDVSVAEVAFLLGYGDQSALNRAFKKWTGETPLGFRKQAQSESVPC